MRKKRMTRLQFMFLLRRRVRRRKKMPAMSIVNLDPRNAINVEIQASLHGVCTYFRSSDGYIYERDSDGRVFRYRDPTQ